MSDEFDTLFQRLQGQQPPRPFDVAELVRRRGRQRSQHQAMAAGLAVVALAGGGGAGLVGVASIDRSVTPSPTSSAPSASPTTLPLPSATPSTSTTPSPTPSPLTTARSLASRMLHKADLGAGSWMTRRPYEPYESGELWRWTGNCREYDPADYPSLRAIQDVDVTGFATGANLDAPYVFQHLTRYAPGWGARAIDDVRRVVSRCRTANPAGTVIDEGFAGDESLLVREEFRPVNADPFVVLVAVVRVGDVTTDIEFSPHHDEAFARSVAEAAARRLAER